MTQNKLVTFSRCNNISRSSVNAGRQCASSNEASKWITCNGRHTTAPVPSSVTRKWHTDDVRRGHGTKLKEKQCSPLALLVFDRRLKSESRALSPVRCHSTYQLRFMGLLMRALVLRVWYTYAPPANSILVLLDRLWSTKAFVAPCTRLQRPAIIHPSSGLIQISLTRYYSRKF
jgi:hypothetical protein